jgi:hypothetical protein
LARPALPWLRATLGHPPPSIPSSQQAFVGLNLRHLLVVDQSNRVAGIITRKDLDHAAGHGWWRMGAQAPKPKQESAAGAAGAPRGGLAGLNDILDGIRKIPSYGFLKAFVQPPGQQHQRRGGGGRGRDGGAPARRAPPPPFGAKARGAIAEAAAGASGSPPASLHAPGTLLGVGQDPSPGSGRTSGGEGGDEACGVSAFGEVWQDDGSGGSGGSGGGGGSSGAGASVGAGDRSAPGSGAGRGGRSAAQL